MWAGNGLETERARGLKGSAFNDVGRALGAKCDRPQPRKTLAGGQAADDSQASGIRHQALIFLAKGGRWCLALESLLQQPDNLLVDAAKMAVAHDNNPIIWLGPLGELSG